MRFCCKRRHQKSGRLLKQSEDWVTMAYWIDGNVRSTTSCARKRS
jgi:hypothetical protein